MSRLNLLLWVLIFQSGFLVNCQNNNQYQKVGGPCEGCEAIHEYGDKVLKPVDTLPQFGELPDPIKVTGTVYKLDGTTPADNVIIYVYHTDHKGVYPKTSNSKGWESRHGYLRGWMKTGKDGKYTFYTSRPASYPNTTVAQHIHITVKEPNLNEYYIDSYHFTDDPNLPKNILNKTNPRGGYGVIQLYKEGNLYVAKRDIVLGKNIPNY